MELHRSRAVGTAAAAILAAGAGLTIYGGLQPNWWLIGGGGFAIVVGASALWEAARPYRFAIGSDGLELRRPPINRLVPWSEIDTVVMAPPVDRNAATPGSRRQARPMLFLVPSEPDFELPLDRVSPWDDRPCALLLDSWDVRERPDDIAAALAEHGGGRFHDLRGGNSAAS